MSITFNLGKFQYNLGPQALVEIATGAYYAYNVSMIGKEALSMIKDPKADFGTKKLY